MDNIYNFKIYGEKNKRKLFFIENSSYAQYTLTFDMVMFVIKLLCLKDFILQYNGEFKNILKTFPIEFLYEMVSSTVVLVTSYMIIMLLTKKLWIIRIDHVGKDINKPTIAVRLLNFFVRTDFSVWLIMNIWHLFRIHMYYDQFIYWGMNLGLRFFIHNTIAKIHLVMIILITIFSVWGIMFFISCTRRVFWPKDSEQKDI